MIFALNLFVCKVYSVPVNIVVSGCFGCIKTPTLGIRIQNIVLFICNFLRAIAATKKLPSDPPQLNKTYFNKDL